MRATQSVKFILGPSLIAGPAAFALVSSMHSRAAAVTSLWASVVLLSLMLLSAGAVALTRRDRRRFKRDVPQKRCPCCGNAMRGIVDVQTGPLWRCVECMRDEEALYSLPPL